MVSIQAILVTPTAPIFRLSSSLLTFGTPLHRSIRNFILFLPSSETDFTDTGDFENYRGVDPLAVDKEARSLLFKYMGDLYRDANSNTGEPTGAGSELSEWESDHGYGLFAHASRPSPSIKLPSEFSTEFLRLDTMNSLRPVPRGMDRAFLFTEPEQSRFFSPKNLAPERIAFADSLRDPASATKSPLVSREYKKESSPWEYMSHASSLAGRLAIYSAALADILFRADELEVSEEDRVTTRALILGLSAMQFSQAARMQIAATSHRRNITLNTLGLRDRFNVSAAVRIPRDGNFLFGGKLLDSIDTDISMQKRAKEVVGKLVLRHASNQKDRTK